MKTRFGYLNICPRSHVHEIVWTASFETLAKSLLLCSAMHHILSPRIQDYP